MKTFTKTIMAGALGLSATLLAAQNASAILITEWGYTVQSGFTAFTPVVSPATPFGVTGSNPNLAIPGSFTTLSWGQDFDGIGNDQSSLTVTATVTNPPNEITNDGIFVDGATLTHNNVVIRSFDQALRTATLTTTLLLDPLQPSPDVDGIPDIGPLARDFNIQFEETLNSVPCVEGSTSICDDIFVVLNPEDLVQSFVIPIPGFNDIEYTITLRAVGLGPLSNSACSAAGEGPGCIGFLTQENQSNILQAEFQITAREIPIPEPGTLAVLGLGLFGLGAVRWRKS